MFLTAAWLNAEDPAVIDESIPSGYTIISALRGGEDAHGHDGGIS